VEVPTPEAPAVTPEMPAVPEAWGVATESGLGDESGGPGVPSPLPAASLPPPAAFAEPKESQNWNIDAGRLERYKNAFSRADRETKGFLVPNEAYEVLSRASLPEDDMIQIWTLADVDKDGRLTLGEFICAMHLTFRRSKEGLQLPAELPSALAAYLSMTPPPALEVTEEAGEADEGWEVSPEEVMHYRETFQRLDANGTGSVGPEEGRDLFERSGLPVPELSHIWKISDYDGDGRLAPVEFLCAMSIVARRRKGFELPARVPHVLHSSVASALPTVAPPLPSGWVATPEELASYRATFQQSADPRGTGFAGGAEVKAILEQSQLPTPELSAIYGVADLDGDGHLSEPEFLCAMALVARRRQGAPIPASVPPELLQVCWPEGRATSALAAEQQSQEDHAEIASSSSSAAAGSVWSLVPGELEGYQQFFAQLAGSSGAVGAEDAREFLESSGLPMDDLAQIWDLSDTDDDGELNLGEFICAMVLSARRRQGCELPDMLPPELVQHLGSTRLDASATKHELASTTQVSSLPESELTLSPAELERYFAMFQDGDSQGTGIMPTERAREILEMSELPLTELSHIWRLSDADMDGQLAAEEFVCAMALTGRRRQGMPLPDALPPDLVAAAKTTVGHR